MEGYNTKRLATVLSDRMKETSGAFSRPYVELGVYNEDDSITPDSLRIAIPKGEYMINFMLTDDQLTSEELYHEHEIPDKLAPLKANDRILIAWCGNEPVVIAKVIQH